MDNPETMVTLGTPQEKKKKKTKKNTTQKTK